jgi:hypothetical protein
LEEALLFEFEQPEDNEATTPTAAGTAAASLASAGSVLTGAGSLPSVLAGGGHGVRSVVKDASGGVHVQAEGYSMHIEEVRVVFVGRVGLRSPLGTRRARPARASKQALHAARFQTPTPHHTKQERATSSGLQTAFNAINVLCGVGLLTTPFTVAITGTSALLLLVLIGARAVRLGRTPVCC